jgi:hypothetical protein
MSNNMTAIMSDFNTRPFSEPVNQEAEYDEFERAIQRINCFPDDFAWIDQDLQLATFRQSLDGEEEVAEYGPQVDAQGRIIPQRFDIICGRDRVSHSHCGNKRFRVIIEMNRERYQNKIPRNDKSAITAELVTMIRSCRPGGRFLKMDENNNWYDVGDEYAKEKVSHALRSAKDPHRVKIRKKRTNDSGSSTSEQGKDVFAELLRVQQEIFEKLVLEDESRPIKKLRTDNSSCEKTDDSTLDSSSEEDDS